MVKVNVFQVANDGSNYFRQQLPALAAKASGADVELIPFSTQARECDVVVLNRPASAHHVQVVKQMIADGYAVVIDLDDCLGRVPTNHDIYPRAKEYDEYCKRACELATAVTGTTNQVIEDYGFGKGVVVPNYVPEWYLDITNIHPHKGTWIGWSGTVGSHPRDLQVTNGQVARVVKETGAQLAYVGPKPQSHLVSEALQYKGRILEGGWYTFEAYPHAISEFDIGIVPLDDTTFNRGKSYLKGLEMAAVGVPFVASPTEEYVRLHDLGAGLLAHRPNEWRRHLNDLVNDLEYRTAVAVKGREAAAQLTIEDHVEEWVNVWKNADSEVRRA